MSLDFNLVPKLSDPLCIKVEEYGVRLLASEGVNQEYDLKKGAVFGNEHYGFIVISDINGEPSETIYPTQCPLYGMELKDNMIRVYERHKYVFWKFDITGNLIAPAQFLDISRRNLDYLPEQGFGKEKLQEVNEQGYIKKKIIGGTQNDI